MSVERNSKGWPMKDLIYRLDTALVSADSKKLLSEASQALTLMCSELESLRADWVRLKMLYELDGLPNQSLFGWRADWAMASKMKMDWLKLAHQIDADQGCDSES